MSAVTADRVVVELEARLGRYEANVARAERKFDQAMSGIQRSAGATEAFISRAVGRMAAVLGGVSVIALARSFLSLSDEAKKLDAQLRLATQGFGSFGQAQKDVRRIADETRSGLSETARLYANFTRGAKELGASQADAARATETFSKSLKISGASAAEAASATLQFGQALASGALRGDELNSILEASPRLARLIAESMDKPIGQIRKLGEEGQLTSDRLLRALTDKKFTAGIDAEFRQLPITFDDAMTRVYNAALTTISAFDRGGEFSKMLANFVAGGADGFRDLEREAERFGIDTRAVIEGLADAFGPLVAAGKSAAAELGIEFSNLGINIRRDIQASLDDIDRLTKWINDRTVNSRLLPDFVYGGTATGRPQLAGTSFGAGFREGSNRARSLGNRQSAERQIQPMFGGLDPFGNPLPGARAGTAIPAASGGKVNKDLENSQKLLADLEKLKAKASGEELKRINERIARQKKIVEYLKLGVSKEAATAALGSSSGARGADKSPLDPEAFAREQASLNDQILRLKADEATSAKERADIELQRIEASKAARLREIGNEKRYTADGKRKNSALAETVAALEAAKVIRERDAELAWQALEARRENERYERDALESEARAADTRDARLAAEMRILALLERQEREELEAAVAAGKVADANRARADLARAQAARRQRIDDDNASPVEDYARSLRKTPGQIRDDVEGFVIDELQHVQDGIASALQKAIGTKDPLITGLINLLIEQVIMRPIAEALAGVGGGGGGGFIGGVFSSIGLPGFAGGGSMTLGGRGGTDTNRLSLNGRPIANVSRGETLSIGNKALRPGGSAATVVQHITVDARNSVNPEGFERRILAISGQQASQAAGLMGKSVMKAMPARLVQYQNDGT